jgi:hypothetical protein
MGLKHIGICMKSLAIIMAPSLVLAQIPANLKPPSFLRLAFDGKGKTLKSLFEADKINEFLLFYNDNAVVLGKSAPRFDYWYYHIAQEFNDNFEKTLDPLAVAVTSAIQEPDLPQPRWGEIKTLLQALTDLQTDYESFTLLGDPRFTSPGLPRLKQSIQQLQGYLDEHRAKGFKDYLAGDTRTSFFDLYPGLDLAEETRFYSQNLPLLLEHVGSLSRIEDDPMVGHLMTVLAPQAMVEYIEASPQLKGTDGSWSRFCHLVTYLYNQRFPAAVIARIVDHKVAVYLLPPLETTSAGVAPVQFEGFSPRPATPAVGAPFLLAAHETGKFAIVFTGLSLRTSRMVVERQEKPSQYVAGYHLEPNPAWSEARSQLMVARFRCEQATRDQENYEANNTGNGFGAALAGAAVGLNASWAQNAYQEALAAFQNTPTQIRVADMLSYAYVTTKVQVQKDLEGSVYLLDPGARQMSKAPLSKTFRATFELVADLNRNDPRYSDLLNGFQPESAVANEEATPPRLDFQGILGLVTEAPFTPQKFTDFSGESKPDAPVARRPKPRKIPKGGVPVISNL